MFEQQADWRKVSASILMVFFTFQHFEVMGCFFRLCPCHKVLPALSDEDIKLDSENGELDNLRRNYKEEKRASLSLKNWNVTIGNYTRQPKMINNKSDKTFASSWLTISRTKEQKTSWLLSMRPWSTLWNEGQLC